MKTVNIHEAKTRLSRLVEEAARCESFIIAKAGRPIALVTALQAPEKPEVRRLDFLNGHISVPDDFDEMGCAEIEEIFHGKV
jgi:antitoxin (DNA-binding transcriptional repressor) of toxin-antitoxin stability system